MFKTIILFAVLYMCYRAWKAYIAYTSSIEEKLDTELSNLNREEINLRTEEKVVDKTGEVIDKRKVVEEKRNALNTDLINLLTTKAAKDLSLDMSMTPGLRSDR